MEVNRGNSEEPEISVLHRVFDEEHLTVPHKQDFWAFFIYVLTGLQLMGPVKNGKKNNPLGPSERNGLLFHVGI